MKKENAISLDFKKTIKLPYNHNNLHIVFSNSDSLITQLSPLEPFGFVNNSRSVYYNNLEGGRYVFYLKNRQSKQVLDTISIEIEMPFYKNWWFVLLLFLYVVFVIGIIIYIFLNYRFRQQTKLLKVRNNIASDLHDEVGSTLSSIGIATKLIQKKLGNNAPDITDILTRIKTDSDESVQQIRDTVWSLNPENDSLEKLIERIQAFAQKMLVPQGILVKFDCDVKLDKAYKMDMAQRRDLYMIVKEAINNIAKHSEATQANVKCIMQNGECKFEISDNGKGFDTDQGHEGNGLKNFKKRATDSGFEVAVQSAIGKGTTIDIRVK